MSVIEGYKLEKKILYQRKEGVEVQGHARVEYDPMICHRDKEREGQATSNLVGERIGIKGRPSRGWLVGWFSSLLFLGSRSMQPHSFSLSCSWDSLPTQCSVSLLLSFIHSLTRNPAVFHHASAYYLSWSSICLRPSQLPPCCLSYFSASQAHKTVTCTLVNKKQRRDVL